MKYGRYELKKLKIHDEMSRGTTCFSCELFVDGQPFAHVSNEGNGGCNRVHPLGSHRYGDIETLTAEMLADPVLVLEGSFEPFDTAIGSMIAMHDDLKTLTRLMKTKVAWYDDDMNIASTGYKDKKLPVDQRLIDIVSAQVPGVVLLNTVEDVVAHVSAASQRRNEKMKAELDAMSCRNDSPRP